MQVLRLAEKVGLAKLGHIVLTMGGAALWHASAAEPAGPSVVGPYV